jgi:Arc/MetJ-type ribon-helix-helix transcriptional regulator
MRTTSVNVRFTEKELDAIDMNVENGLYKNRADFIRTSVRKVLEDRPQKQYTRHTKNDKEGT